MQSRTVCFWPVVPLGFGGRRLGSRLLGGGGSSRALRALPLIFSILLRRLAGLPACSGLKKPYIYYVFGSGSVESPGSGFVIICSDPDPDPSIIKQN